LHKICQKGEHTLNQANKQERKVVLVTGAARRIGAAIVKNFHQAGYNVLIHCYHSIKEAEQLSAFLNAQVTNTAKVISLDLTDPAAALQLIEAVITWAGRLDVLINNASLFTQTDTQYFDEDHWHSLFNIHVKAPYALSCAAKNYLAQQQGAIINITDIHAQKPLKGYGVYCQSKAALEMQTMSLARDWAPNIRVNAIAPGSTLWPESANRLSAEDKQKVLSKTLLAGHGDAEPLAQMVLALAENSFITGQVLNVDGGRSLT
jgi:pteridine reductase